MANRFGNYEKLRVSLDKKSIDYLQVPLEFDEYSFLIAQKYAIAFRDEMLVANLERLGVVTLLDVGCDFGSLLYSAGSQGITARGVDISESALSLAKMADLDVVKYSIDQIILDRSFQNVSLPYGKGVSAVSCLNILHGEWDDTGKRDLFLDICLDNYDYVVITVTRELFRHIQKTFSLTYVQFIGPANRPIHKVSSQISQYGTTFFFKGILHIVECHFWRILLGHRSYPNPVNNYLSLTVIISNRTQSVRARNQNRIKLVKKEVSD